MATATETTGGRTALTRPAQCRDVLEVEGLQTYLFTRSASSRRSTTCRCGAAAAKPWRSSARSGCGKTMTALSLHAPGAQPAGPHRRRLDQDRRQGSGDTQREPRCATSAATRSR